MLRCLPPILLLGLLAACTKQLPLPETVIPGANSAEFTRFRAELAARFPASQLTDFDTAIKELQLDAMNRDLPSVALREADMLRMVNGKTVHAATILGWKARRDRFKREIAMLTRVLERDLEEEARHAATGTPAAVTRRIASAREVLAKLDRDLAATEQHLATLGARPEKSP
jgi:hypothetical protein